MLKVKHFIALFLGYLLFSSCLSDNDNSIDVQRRIKKKSEEAFEFIQSNDFNDIFCLLVDFSIHSGKNRLFVWDFDSSKTILESLVSHGSGPSQWSSDLTKDSPVFSNVVDSHCSSLGKYKIGKRGWSNWGIHVNYKLHGLESTNNNAYKRVIVLHSWDAMPNAEVYPKGCPESWGCPAVSNEVMKNLTHYYRHHQSLQCCGFIANKNKKRPVFLRSLNFIS